ncbi:hypothetical protein MC7420_4413 [Coleofasciculus chthonoplastes PCC 7420]|uniref:Uncharacterized protein n=1 Tax=Coleofasciculus chthonoplastes PCC 7420 TaxID=118168 RepID=B4VY51_9CYAN|nr:hypothetical protein [Coleofasciculus chthonoplastes]EDX73166.1 hypothetical protein MC7420_4413 [Coleofasciculus chthonoplastes PCC 7420]
MKLIEWLRQLFIENLAEEKPTPLKELTRLTSENLVVKNLKKPTREEYLKWAKERANYYIDKGELTNAFNSFCSDMDKHAETKNNPYLRIGRQIILGGGLKTAEEMREFINGFE